MNEMYQKLLRCAECVRESISEDFVPEIGLVLGSGLGGFAEEIKIEASVDYKDIEGFPVSTVAGHNGRLIFGTLDGVKLVCMQGRVHYYEGYSMQDVVLPVRLMKILGAKTLFLTNASGGISPELKAGDFMLLTDHISSFVPNPLIGANAEELGVRFPDMSQVYSKDLREIIKQTAKENNIEIKEGVYVQLTGPSYESPAEIIMMGRLGADAVGMSTVCEAIAANHMGMKVCGISCVSNLAAGISKQPLSHKEVQETADRVAPLFRKLVAQSIKNISRTGE